MARSANGSSDKIVSGTFTGPNRWSLSCWFRSKHAPGSGFNRQIVEVGGGTYSAELIWDHSNGAFIHSAAQFDSTDGFISAQWTTNLVADTWYHLGGMWDGSKVYAVLNGRIEASNVALDPPAAQTVAIRAFTESSGSNFLEGRMARLCFWNAALNTQEWLALGRGADPRTIRPQAIVDGTDLRSEPVGYRNLGWTKTGTAAADDPPIYYKPPTVLTKMIAQPVLVQVPYQPVYQRGPILAQ